MLNESLVAVLNAIEGAHVLVIQANGLEAIEVDAGGSEYLLVTSWDRQLPFTEAGEINYGLLVREFAGYWEESQILFDSRTDVDGMLKAILQWIDNKQECVKDGRI